MDKNIGIMAKRNNVARKDITEVMIAGNTVMEHLFAGVSPKSIGHSPYKPEFYQSPLVHPISVYISVKPASSK